MATSVLMAEVSGGHVHRRLRLGWMDGVNGGLGLHKDDCKPHENM